MYHSWVRSLWESVQAYNLDVTLEYLSVSAPRENDVLIATLSVSSGLHGDDLESFRRCRVVSNALFLSCLASTNSRALDPTRGQPNVDYTRLSTYDSPRERPSPADWEVRRKFWKHCLPGGSLPHGLGKWRHATHRIWEWFHDATTDTALRQEGEHFRLCHPCGISPGATTRA